MARKETPEQQEIVGRVMHEFKHGELRRGRGGKVKNPRQAIAIALSEAGASNQQSPQENKRALKQTRRREGRGETGQARAEAAPTRAELYERAKREGVPGRSKMNKAELQRALEFEAALIARRWLVAIAIAAFAVAPARAADLLLICRLRQIGAGSATNFIRKLEIDPQAKTVTIADDMGRGFRNLPMTGMLVQFDRSKIVFDYVDAVSLGQSVIRWHSGAYSFKDGKFAVRGSCASALPDSGVGAR